MLTTVIGVSAPANDHSDGRGKFKPVNIDSDILPDDRLALHSALCRVSSSLEAVAVGNSCHTRTIAPELGPPSPDNGILDASEDDAIEASRTFREKLHAVFDPSVPHSAPMRRVSYGISVVILAAILISTVSFCCETVPSLKDSSSHIFDAIEYVSVTVFTVEYLLRLVSASDTLAFVVDVMNIIDVVALLPSYITFVLEAFEDSGAGFSGLIVLRAVRLTRVFRVFKLSKFSVGLTVVISSVFKSAEALAFLGCILSLCLLVASSALYFTELTAAEFDPYRRLWIRNDPRYFGTVSPFQSILHTLWWAVVTVTTTGYGPPDVPVTWIGRLVAAFTMLCGLLVIAFPTVLIGRSFSAMHQQISLFREHKELNSQAASGLRPVAQAMHIKSMGASLTSFSASNDAVGSPSSVESFGKQNTGPALNNPHLISLAVDEGSPTYGRERKASMSALKARFQASFSRGARVAPEELTLQIPPRDAPIITVSNPSGTTLPSALDRTLPSVASAVPLEDAKADVPARDLGGSSINSLYFGCLQDLGQVILLKQQATTNLNRANDFSVTSFDQMAALYNVMGEFLHFDGMGVDLPAGHDSTTTLPGP